MALVGLPGSVADVLPSQLSGGQRQRVSIARALALEPALIIADEPTSALDVSVRAQILNLLLDLKERLGLAMVFVSHDIQTVKRVSDRVVTMYLGRIVEQTPAAVLPEGAQHPYTRALFSATPGLLSPIDPIPLVGPVPSATRPPSGCPFRTRCWKATDICATEMPDPAGDRRGTVVAARVPLLPPSSRGDQRRRARRARARRPPAAPPQTDPATPGPANRMSRRQRDQPHRPVRRRRAADRDPTQRGAAASTSRPSSASSRRQLEAGVHGIFALGSSGETVFLTDEQRDRALEVIVKTTGGKVPVIAGLHRAVDPAGHRARPRPPCASGADALVTTAPFYAIVGPARDRAALPRRRRGHRPAAARLRHPGLRAHQAVGRAAHPARGRRRHRRCQGLQRRRRRLPPAAASRCGTTLPTPTSARSPATRSSSTR